MGKGTEVALGDAIERANQLREALNGSAGLVRNLFLTFLLLGTYIAVTIGSTSDEQLLRISPVTLPILDVDLPIVAFYAVVPWLLVLFHFNLLLQLYLLARQLHLFNAAVAAIPDEGERTTQRVRLFPFPLVHMLAGVSDARVTRLLFSLIVWVTIVWLPLALIVSAQVRFLPYHDPTLIGWSRLAVLLDVGLLWTFWPLIESPSMQPAASWWGCAIRAPKRWFSHLNALYGRLRQAEVQGTNGSLWDSRARGSATLLFTSVLALGFSFVVAVVPGEPIEGWVATVLPVPGSDREPGRGPPGNLLTHWVFDGPRAPLHRNLELAEHILLAEAVGPELLRDLIGADEDQRSAVLARVSGIDLSGRDLRHANLHRAILPRADLRGANLDGADLRRADLSLADLRPLEIEASDSCVDTAQLRTLKEKSDIRTAGGQYVADAPTVCVTTLQRGARLNEARLSKASLNFALLEGADFREAKLDEAKLPGADLTRARLEKASMQGAKLQSADLTEANLTRTTLDRASLRRVKMSGAILKQTSLRGAKVSVAESTDLVVDEPDMTAGSLTNADLRGARISQGAFASFSGSNLRGADLSGGTFRGAIFKNSNLRQANLSGAKLAGADFEGADLSDAQLSGANLNLAKFIRMSACRTDFRGAQLRGAHFEVVALHGATLRDAKLDLAVLSQVYARALDARGARFNAADVYGLQVDYGDLRDLFGDLTRGVRMPKLLTIASELRSNDRRVTKRQEDVLAAAESGTPLRESRRSDATYSEAPVLCDETTSLLIGARDKHCMTEDLLLEYVEKVTAAACGDRNIAAGLFYRLERPKDPVEGRGGNVIAIPPVDEYSRLLAAGMAKEDCPALTSFDQGKRQLLNKILKRNKIATPSPLANPDSIASHLPDAPLCEPR